MTDEEDPFAGLGDDLDREAGGRADSEADLNQQPGPESDDVLVNSERESGGDIADRPAFPYDDVSQQPLYARSEAWDEFEDMLDFEVRRSLRDEGLRDVPKRELHDAALRVVSDHADEIVAAVKYERPRE